MKQRIAKPSRSKEGREKHSKVETTKQSKRMQTKVRPLDRDGWEELIYNWHGHPPSAHHDQKLQFDSLQTQINQLTEFMVQWDGRARRLEHSVQDVMDLLHAEQTNRQSGGWRQSTVARGQEADRELLKVLGTIADRLVEWDQIRRTNTNDTSRAYEAPAQANLQPPKEVSTGSNWGHSELEVFPQMMQRSKEFDEMRESLLRYESAADKLSEASGLNGGLEMPQFYEKSKGGRLKSLMRKMGKTEVESLGGPMGVTGPLGLGGTNLQSVHEGLSLLQRQKVKEVLLCVAQLISAQHELETITEDMTREVPAMRLDQALQHVGQVDLMQTAMESSMRQLHQLKAKLLKRAAGTAVSKAVHRHRRTVNTVTPSPLKLSQPSSEAFGGSNSSFHRSALY
jgi:hypothetical protein